jgi:hypothetical protein
MPEENDIVIPMPDGIADAHEESAELSELAKEMGWNPDFEESDGKERLSAKEFIKKGRDIQKDMRKRIKSQSDSIEDLTSSMKGIQEHFSNVSKAEIAKAKKDLKIRRDEAIIDGEIDTVDAIDAEMEALKAKEKAPNKTEEQGKKEFEAWSKDNKWFGNDGDLDMSDYAQYKINIAIRKNPNMTPAEQMAYARDSVEKKFPEYFGKEKQDRRPPASAVNEGGSRPGSNSNTYTAADLTSDQRKIMRAFTKHGMMTEKEYINELKATGALK